MLFGIREKLPPKITKNRHLPKTVDSVHWTHTILTKQNFVSPSKIEKIMQKLRYLITSYLNTVVYVHKM